MKCRRTRTGPGHVLASILLLLLAAGPADGSDFTRADRQLLWQWVRERAAAVQVYTSRWLQGAPMEDLAPSGTAIVTTEAHIVALALGQPGVLVRYSLLWEETVTPKTLPVLLLEKYYGVDLAVSPLFVVAPVFDEGSLR